MVLTQRERQYAIIAGSLLGVLILYFWVLGPYFKARAEIAADIEKYNIELTNADVLAKRQVQMRKIEKALIAGGLENSSNEAQSQLGNNLAEWAQEAGVNVTQLNLATTISQAAKNSPEAKFHVIGFHLTGTGPQITLSRLLWRIETAAMPIRVSEIQIQPRNGKEGQDDLQFTLAVSTLCRDSERFGRSAESTADARGGL
jgi:hypothetical protein